MKRLIKNSVCAVIIAVILVAASRTFEGHQTNEVIGDTPAQKAASLERILNTVKENNFARVFSSEHDSKEGSWLYTVMVNEPDILLAGKANFADPTGQQSAQLKRLAFFEIIGRIFVETARFDESAKVITVKVIFPIALDKTGLEQGLVYKAEKDAVSAIRKNGETWKEIVRDPEPLFAFYPSMNRTKVTEIDGKTPLEKVTSLVAFLNDRKANDFERVFFDDYDGKNGIWKYTVLVIDPSIFQAGADAQEQIVKQFKIEMHWDNIKNLFVRTAEWDETAKGIVVKVIFPQPIESNSFAYGFVYIANETGITNIRKFVENWSLYVLSDNPEKLMVIPQSIFGALLKQETSTGDESAEKVSESKEEQK